MPNEIVLPETVHLLENKGLTPLDWEAQSRVAVAYEGEGYQLGDLPSIAVVITDEDVAGAIREIGIDTFTFIRPSRDEGTLYEVVHGVTDPTERVKHSYSLNDLKDGTRPNPGEAYVVPLKESDRPTIHKEGEIDITDFMKDDGILAVAGNIYARRALREELYEERQGTKLVYPRASQNQPQRIILQSHDNGLVAVPYDGIPTKMLVVKKNN